MAQLAILWVLRNSSVAAAILGTSTPEQLSANVAATRVYLDSETVDAIDDALRPVACADPEANIGAIR